MPISSEIREPDAAVGRNCGPDVPPHAQELPATFAAGERVRVRSDAWLIERVQCHARCTQLDLNRAYGPLTLLHPFDRFAPAAPSRWRRSSLSATAFAVLDAALQGTVLEGLEGGRDGLALPQWQLAVSQAMRNGVSTRVLLADAVGLGKTIQAGLAIAGLRGDGGFSRVLVLAPAGLRDQWTAELVARLGLDPWTADPPSCRLAQSNLPPGVSPWLAHPLVVSSIDYVKQPDVLAAAAAVAWDLVVIDEAHHESPGSDRRAAADLLARRSTRVLLLTATPHDGEDDAYAALCAIGSRAADEPPPLVIRRSRDDVGLGTSARLRIVGIPRSAAECALHDALGAYAALVLDEHRAGAPMAMAWLLKRAASSPEALGRSVERRRALLASAAETAPPTPTWLPFEDEVDERDESDESSPQALACPGLDNRERELRLLDDLSRRSSSATRSWRKAERLVRWLRTSSEPAIVFTEYRATLEALLDVLPADVPVAVLHGGLGRAARQEALARFLCGDARVLVATDVAGEGLNLQATARTVISLEVPWTPSRLQQRIGRVDRIGQTQAVRAICLVSRDGPEALVSARVAGRAARARAALPWRGDSADDLSLLATALGRQAPGHVHRHVPLATPPSSDPPAAARDLGDDVAALAWLVRAAARRAGHRGARHGGDVLPWTRLRLAGPDDPLAGSVVVVFVAETVASSGRSVAHAAVALNVSVATAVRRDPPALLRELVSSLAPVAARAARDRLAISRRAFEARTRAEIARLRRDDVPVAVACAVQPGLFDRRALADAARREADRASRAHDRVDRITRLERDLAGIRELAPVPVAALLCW